MKQNSNWYQNWHNNPNHQLFHWVTFGLASIALIVFTRQDLSSFSKSLDELNPFHINMAEAMTVTVASDRVNIGPEYLPRRTDLPNQLIVPSGQTVELPADSTYDYIEVSGTLRVSRSHNTTTRFTTMIILPGGNLDVGTQSDPIPCNTKVDFTIRDIPINTSIDPYQWGNGLVNFGHQSRVGCTKTGFVQATGSLAAGATSISLASTPSGWSAGDELLIPSTATPTFASNADIGLSPRRETKVTIASINGTSLTLSKGLDFAHNNITDPTNAVILKPRVANVTRNIYIHSENPSGTRGHTADIGNTASWDIRYNELYALGRTKPIPIDDTNLSTGHIGTNVKGKYAMHFHHVETSPGSAAVGNAVHCDNYLCGKWGIAIHNTSDILVDSNVVVGYAGAAISTEDGNEVRDTITNNFAAYTIGNHNGDVNIEKGNVENDNNPGASGIGFWLRGLANTFNNNEAWNNAVGWNFFNQDQAANLMYPSSPGGPEDTAFNRFTAVPLSFNNNVAAANTFDGFEYWGAPLFTNNNAIAAFNGVYQLLQPITQAPKQPYFLNSQLICEPGKSAEAIAAHNAYVSVIRVEGGTIAGCFVGVQNGGVGTYLKNVRMQNYVDVDWSVTVGTGIIDNVNFVPMPGQPAQYIKVGDDKIWDGVSGTNGFSVPDRGSTMTIINYQGTGKNYQLFPKQALSTTLAPQAREDVGNQFSCPEAGLTNGQCWNTYGVTWLGEPIDQADIVSLPGLVTGYAREGTTPRLGAPHVVITSPNSGAPAVIRPGPQPYVRLIGVFTGTPLAASSPIGLLSIDGGPQQQVRGDQGDDVFTIDGKNDTFSFFSTNVAPGIHEVKTWRTDANANPIGTPLVFHYLISAIRLTPTLLNFSGVPGNPAPSAQTVALANTASTSTNWQMSSVVDWCHASPASGSLAGGGNVNVSISVDAPSNRGAFICYMNLTSSNDGVTQTLPVYYFVNGGTTTPPGPPIAPAPAPTPTPTPTPNPNPVPPPGPTPPPTTTPPPASSYQRTIMISQFDGRPLTKTITGTVSVLNSSKVLIKSYPFTSTSDGSITVTIDVSPIVGFISIKAAPFLQKIVSIDLNVTAPSIVPKLFIGDVNQDNIVNSIDFSAMNAKWFMADTATDLNQDGLVNTLDYSLMNKNWFVQGDR